MFKKFKDKLAEEVKSSPQRIQQFAQAAQAAVNSASSSISDITNNDLFSIGETDVKTNRQLKPHGNQASMFQDVTLQLPSLESNQETMEGMSIIDNNETPRLRRLSNSSYASDVSFKLPSYESPSMYHLQSDMDVSASEAEDRVLGPRGSSISLDHVSKEQLYSAYRRTQDRYGKYRSRYSDLARHYKILERENAKARSVLVETQDKALRRISELREQCSLEQSAKAHLESALRVELEEKSMIIESLNTKVQLLQNNVNQNTQSDKIGEINNAEVSNNEAQLIDLTEDKTQQQPLGTYENNNKLQKLEQLLSKYKDSLKNYKEKNSQLNAEVQIISKDLESKMIEIQTFNENKSKLEESQKEIIQLKDDIEELQNKLNSYDFNKVKEIASLQSDLKQSQEEIVILEKQIETFHKREEDYAISLAENKLSIHKELESKEAEIKSLKDSITSKNNEVQLLKKSLKEYKDSIESLEQEKIKLLDEITETNATKNKYTELDTICLELKGKYQSLLTSYNKALEENKCMELQLKQETAEKLAMVDRNNYLEDKNKQILEDCLKKTQQVSNLEAKTNELSQIDNAGDKLDNLIKERDGFMCEIDMWKNKYNSLEHEIQEERIELVKLQTEIEKLLQNHEIIQASNIEFTSLISKLKSDNKILENKIETFVNINSYINQIKTNVNDLCNQIKTLKNTTTITHKDFLNNWLLETNEAFKEVVKNLLKSQEKESTFSKNEIKKLRDCLDELEKKNTEIEALNTNYNHRLKKLENENEKLSEDVNESNLTNEVLRKEIIALKELHKNYNENSETSQKEYQLLLENFDQLKQEKELFQKDKLDCEVTFTAKTTELLEIIEQNKINEEVNHTQSLELTNENENLHRTISDNKEIILELNNKINSLETLLLESENCKTNIQRLHDKCELLKQEKENLYEKILVCEQQLVDHEINKKLLEEALETNEGHLLHISYLEKELEEVKKSETVVDNENNVIIKYEKIKENYNVLHTEMDILREDNKRLMSEIEGLQSHLQKVSKDNSLLNDKLREMIVTSDSNYDNAQIQKKYVNDISENSKIENKDFESTKRTLSDNDMKSKYESLLLTKENLEKKLTEYELLNISADKNWEHVQNNNEKLKLTNEKLERKLDEALVSLRHFQALEESTELEYLRNVLYEYLTGSGNHAVTLAKVLSAVVKFDDKQTQFVLQREKERQGLLRQLGFL